MIEIIRQCLVADGVVREMNEIITWLQSVLVILVCLCSVYSPLLAYLIYCQLYTNYK